MTAARWPNIQLKGHLMVVSSPPIWLFSLLLLWGALSLAEELKNEPFRIYFTANRQGEIDPCGCQTGQIGGIDRLKNYLDQESQKKTTPKATLFVDSGDTFFSGPSINPIRRDEEMQRATLIAHSYRRMNLELFTPGERDFADGLDTLREFKRLSRATFLATNLVMAPNEEPLFEKVFVTERAGLKIGVLGLLDEKVFEGIKGITVTSVEDALDDEVKKLKEKGIDVIIVLSHLGLEQDRKIAKKEGVDIILGSHSMDALSKAELVDKTLIGQPSIEGQQIGVIDYNRTAPEMSAYKLVELDDKFGEPNEITEFIELYKERVRQIGTASAEQLAKKKKPKSIAFVAHPAQCRTCHEAQYDFWNNTHHSSAYMVLFSKNQHFNPECISCHSLGYLDPKGFQKIAKPIAIRKKPKEMKEKEVFAEFLMKQVFGEDIKKGALDSRKQPERHKKLHEKYKKLVHEYEEKEIIENLYIGVQCEHCHGIRQGHPDPKVMTQKKVNKSSCNQCHSPPNDNTFNFGKDVKLVGCPLMAK